MSSYYILTSKLRDRNTWPNPAQYEINDEQVRTWSKEPRNVSATSTRPGSRVVEAYQSLQIKTCYMPYTDITYTTQDGTVVTEPLTNIPVLYVDIHTRNYNDSSLINSPDNIHRKDKFLLTKSHVDYDALGLPRWIFYHCNMDQVTRYARNEPVWVSFSQEDGRTIVIPDPGATPDPLMQTFMNLEVIPYFRDGHYSNQGIGLTQF
jgi:hypothetical protein